MHVEKNVKKTKAKGTAVTLAALKFTGISV